MGQPTTETTRALRPRLVRHLERTSAIRSTAVRDAFLAVPREIFVPAIAETHGVKAVYRDEAIPTKTDTFGNAISSSSQPGIMAEMLEELRVAPGQRVLEIGAGTGYNAALLGLLVGPRGRVTSVELDPDVAAGARSALKQVGARVTVPVRDGRRGWERGSPYDRIIVTASSLDVPRALLDQLKEGGLLVLPLRLTDAFPFRQVVATFERRGDRLESVSVIRGGFMRLRERTEDVSLPWPELKVVATREGKERTLATLSGSTLEILHEHVKRSLLSVMLTTPRPCSLGIRASGWTLYELEAFLALAAPEDRLVGCTRQDLQHLVFMNTALLGLVDLAGEGLSHLAGGKVVSRLDTYGVRTPERELTALIDEWTRMGRPGAEQLQIAVSYGSGSPRAWRVKKRGASTISFDWSRR
jgi:protein-L-isoaspartate(D-aspartate) O-methyltransferase